MIGKIVLLAFVASAAAQGTFKFKAGNNLNFDEVSNWNEGVVPTETAGVGIVDMSSDTPYSTFVEEGVYSAGRIILADNGRLVFSDDGDVRIVLDDMSLGDNATTATFKGPRMDEAFDFNCIKNWERVGSSAPVTQPPCSGDTVLLERDTSNYFFVGDDVQQVPLNALQYEDNTPIEQDSLPPYVFDQGLASKLSIRPPGGFDCPVRDTGGACVCSNSCPTEEQSLAQNFRVLRLLQAAAQDQLALLAAERNVEVTATTSFPLEDAPASGDFLATYLGLMGPSSVSFTQVTQAAAQITIKGDVTASSGLFIVPGEDIQSVDEYDMMLAAFGSDQQTPFDKLMYASMYMVNVQRALFDDATCTSVGAGCQYASAIASLFTDAAGVMASICPADAACKAADAIMADFVAADKTNLAMHIPMSVAGPVLQAIADGLAGASNTTAAAAALTTNAAAATAAIASVPAPVQGSAVVELGALFPEIFRYRLINPDNAQGVQDAMAMMLDNLGPIVTADSFELMISGSERRRADEVSIQAMVNFTSAGTGMLSDTMLAEAQNRLNMAATARDIETDSCFSLETMMFDMACLTSEAAASLPVDATENDYIAYVRARVACDSRGQRMDGTCYGPNPDAEATASTAGKAAFAQKAKEEQEKKEAEAAGSSGSDSNGSMPIIIGAAIAGVVLLAVVAFFVTRRNRGASTAAKQQDRSVVAFNNPLYDEGGNALEATYDNPAQDGEDGGIYDEPAFNQGNNKNNPLYDSNENLADDAMGEGYMTTEGLPEGDGYLATDASTHQDGYVDTNPDDNFGGFGDNGDDMAEEGGYLDVGEEDGAFGGFDDDDDQADGFDEDDE